MIADIRIEITGVGSRLNGVGRAPDGRAVFVDGALPGELVRARITAEKDRYMTAEVAEVLVPSAGRADPACPHYGVCGGCAAQHMSYQTSLELKQRLVVDAIGRIGGEREARVDPVAGMERPWRYRNKAEYMVARVAGEWRIGYARRGSHEIVDIDDCPLQAEGNADVISAVKRFLPGGGFEGLSGLVVRTGPEGDMMVILAHTGRRPAALPGMARQIARELPRAISVYGCALRARAAHATDGEFALLSGAPELSDHILGVNVRLSSGSFFQVNRAQAGVLFGEAARAADVAAGGSVIDAYCGVGALTLYLARAGADAVGVEIYLGAVEDARRNAEANRLQGRARFVCGDAARELPGLLAELGGGGTVVVDPPRRGVDAALIDALIAAQPERIVYISCNPATLARDVRLIVGGGEYELKYIKPVDMFCWTEHVESVALLTKI